MTRGNDYDGQLIAIEGLDGSGKSGAVEAIESWSNSRPDIEVVTTAEPWGPIEDRDDVTQFLWFCADRREHTVEVIEPALERGAIVVTDRYADSTRAYQTHLVADALDISYDEARRYVDEIMEPWTIEPDLTFYIDIDVDTALERCDREDKFETRENLRKVKEAYTRMYSHCDPGCRIVDGTLSESYTRHQAVNAVKSVVTDANRGGDQSTSDRQPVEADNDSYEDTDSRGGADGGGRTYADAVGSRDGEE